jgi:Xaa-Pro dipeptidase
MYDTDVEWDFRQESNFQYLFGVKEPDCIGFLRISDGKSGLFIPQLAPVYETWMGPIKPPAWFHRAYEIDEVDFLENVKDVLKGLKAKKPFELQGQES